MAKNTSSKSQNSDIASSPSDMRSRIVNYLRAGHAGLYITSPEEQRVQAELKAIAKEVSFALFAWSTTTGLVDIEKGTIRQANDPLEALLAIQELPERTIILLKDFHLFLLGEPNPVLLRHLKDSLQEGKSRNKPIVILGCRLCMPPELEREITVVEFALPGKEQLGQVLDGVLESAGIESLATTDREAALMAGCGLTTNEAEDAYALCIAEAKTIVPSVIAREKAQAVKKNGLLEIIESKESLESIGGLEVLKDWLIKRRNAFGKKAREYGLPIPKGLLIIGIPGTGKSLTAKVAAQVFGVPTLKVDFGRLYGGLVGASEANLRSALATAEAIAPAVLWIDECEKGLAGSKSSGATDGGTSARVLGSLLSWMQEKTSQVFVVATANDVSQLPPELLRAGRWDQMFFVDLPNIEERQAIWQIQIRKHGRNPGDFETRQLARASEALTGAEIEAVFVESLYDAFDRNSEPTDLDIAKVLTEFVPLSKTMAEQITGLRNWAKGRARPATSTDSAKEMRKMMV